ncbi:hypothetical protein [Roseibacillus persicicus]|uniref:MAM domain-containing protein n=1 Tax=Roseibacillus persicicus TaxID=454148 RepID=A0A918WMP9_9BACT|nr:hypothetical protein [Roseibacillus persicicus]GHC60206.1 hypothetical protein GCM10007100_29350 [Roseibacillus persicicus]
MKTKTKNQVVGLLVGATMGAYAVPVLVPNGDFEDAGGPATSWQENFGGGTFTYLYPETEGNADGHVVIDNIDSGYGLLIANNNTPISLAGLGITAGDTYRFSQDMRFTPESVFGSSVGTTDMGGLKVEFYAGGELLGSTGDLFPEVIGFGDTWESYDFDIHIPNGVDGIKVILLWGLQSTVSFDNVRIESDALPPVTGIPNGDFSIPDGDSWGLNDDDGFAVIEYPATGGSGDDGGYGLIDATSAFFGVLISQSDQVLPVAGLGLEPGKTYHFHQDMKLFSGANIGGLKVEFYSFGTQHSTTGNLCPELIGGGDWNTYTFPVRIPPNADGIKVVALYGEESSVGYDNFNIDPVAVSDSPVTGIPNGDFSEGGKNWATAGEPDTVFAYPDTGGNPGGCAEMTNSGFGFGVLVANAESSIPLESLGLTGGNAYTFKMDTYRVAGTDVGKLKVEFYRRGIAQGNSGDIAATTETGVWTSNDFQVSIPSDADAIRVVPVAGIDSVIRYDNLAVDPTPIEAPVIPNLDFEQGGAGWAFFSSGNTVTYPTTGGSDLKGSPDGGYASIDSPSGWAVLVASSGAIIALDDLGLSAGDDFTVEMDMKNFGVGAAVGSLKLEWYSGTSGGQPTGDEQAISPEPIEPADEWQTYTFNFSIPNTIGAGGVVDGFKLVPIAAIPGVIGYDNIEFLSSNEPVSITIAASGFDASGNFFIDVLEGVSGLQVTTSPDLASEFVSATGVTNDGANRFTIPAANLDSNTDGADFFRVEESS